MEGVPLGPSMDVPAGITPPQLELLLRKLVRDTFPWNEFSMEEFLRKTVPSQSAATLIASTLKI